GLAGIVDFFARHGPLIQAIADAATTDERIEQAYRTGIENLIELTTRSYERLAAEGYVDIPDPRAQARAMTLMNEAFLLDEFGRSGEGDRDLALTTLQTIWIRVAGYQGDAAAGQPSSS